SGAVLVVPPPEVSRDAAALASTIAEHGVSVLEIVPSMLGVLVEQPGLARCRLARIVSGGETLGVDLAKRAIARLPAVLVNTYGPTETTVDVTHWIVTSTDG